MSFKKFKLEKPNECDMNYIDIFEEQTDLKNRVKHYCGSVADPFATNGTILQFRYFAIPSALNTKFVAWFTAFRERTSEGETSEGREGLGEEYERKLGFKRRM